METQILYTESGLGSHPSYFFFLTVLEPVMKIGWISWVPLCTIKVKTIYPFPERKLKTVGVTQIKPGVFWKN